MVDVTKVLYDVSQAIKELTKLDKKSKKSGDTAKKSLEGKGGGAVKKFGDIAGKATPKLSGLVSKVKSFASSGGLIAAGFAVAGAAVVSVITNVLGLADALADVDAGLNTINETAERALRLQNLRSTIGDELKNFELKEAKRAIIEKQAATIRKQNSLEVARGEARELLTINKDRLSQVQSQQRDAARATQDAEKRLADKRRELGGGVGGEFSARPKGRQVIDLTAKAQQEAQKGNIDNAEALIDKAKELSNELGNHAFFTNKIDAAQQGVVRALEKDVAKSKDKSSGLAKQEKELQKLVDRDQQRLEFLNAQLASILRANRELSVQNKLLKIETKQETEAQFAEEGARQTAAGVRQITGISTAIGDQSGFGQVIQQLKDTASALKSDALQGRFASIQGGRASIELILGELNNTLSTVFKDGKVTIDESADVIGTTERVGDALGLVQQQLDEGRLSGVIKKDAERILQLFKGLENIGKGAVLGARGGARGDESAEEAGQRLRSAQEKVVTRREIQQNIQVKIEGGMLDEKTIEQITQVIQEQLRKQTSKGAGAD